MRIIYRSIQATFLVVFALLTILPLQAQLTEKQREEIKEKAREARVKKVKGPQQPVAVKKANIPLPAPRIVNFTERANWELTHPVDKSKRLVDQEEAEEGFKFKSLPVGPNAKVSPIPGNKPGTAGNNAKAGTSSPAPILSFTGVVSDDITIPPDINAAAGITYVMETTNQQFGIFNKTNGTQVSNVSLNGFCKNETTDTTTTGYYDPHILYDAPHGRFLGVVDATLSNGHGGLFLVISETSDPTGNWYVYTIDGGVTQTGSSSANLLDFPEMGYNENWVVLTANQFTSSATTAEVYVMDRATLYNGTQGTITHFSEANSFCLSPAQTMDTTTLTEYLVENYNGSSNGSGYVNISSITGTSTSPTYNSGSQLGVAQPWNDNAVMAAQQGTTALLDNDDPRIFASEYINGSLWFAHTVWLPASGTATSSAADWWQVNPATLTVQQFGRISTASTWYFYPNIYANANGDAILSYGVSSPTEYASAIYSYHAAADAVNTMETLYTYKSGVAGYKPTGFGTDYRWGDFNGASVDPNDGSFWVSGEWADNNNLWATQIAHVGSSAPNNNPPVASFTANTTTSCTGTIQFTDLSSNSPTAWLWSFGDGTTSTLQNPTHTYLANGTFTVTLKATNAYGNNTQTQTSYITINEPAAPSATGASHCGSGTFSLSANTTNPVKWYDSTGTLLSTANPFVTPTLTHTTTYYVSDSTVLAYDTAGPKNNTVLGTGGYLTYNYGLNFDVLQAGTLQSVYINASAAGSVTIYIQNSGGTQVNTATVTVPAGGSRVTLNFPLTVGTGYLINYNSTVNLYRNNAGASYPYNDANGIVSITGNNASAPTYYYWFYDWYVTGPGCNSQSAPVTATVTAGVTISSPTVTNVACNGGTTGSATISPSGGTPAYSYSWSNGQTTATLSGVASGNYTVSVHDASGCSGTASASITQPTALNVSITPVNASCGSATGSATAVVSGGTTSYSYAWSNNATTSVITGLSPATYSVVVTDNHQCTSSATTTISNSGALNVSANPSSTNCTGGSTGGANAVVNGGTSPFTYHWSNGNTTASITGVVAGTYHVTVSDNSGCSGTASVVVATGTGISLTTSATSATCFNAGNGGAAVNITSGNSPYNYVWSNGATTASVSNLAAGNYVVTVTDAHSCQSIDTVVVSQPTVITVFVSTVQPACAGQSTGSASVTGSGGTPGYTYLWSTSSTAIGISGLAAGSYSITLTDAHTCTSSAAFNITDPAAFTANATTVGDSCYQGSNGSAQISPSGGTGPYSYVWSNSSTSATLTNLAAGSYPVTVTDVHNCTTTTTATVSQPSQITISTAATDATNGQSNGTATVSNVSGGNPPYVLTWSNGLSGNTITGLVADTYTVTATDHNGCEASATAIVSLALGITTVNNDLSFTIYPNPAKTEVTVDAGNLNKETTLFLQDVLGQTLVTRNITAATTLDLTNYSDGVYFIELVQNGRRAVRKFVINR